MIWTILFWIGLATVVISYGGYGLWVAWLARVRPRPCRPEYLADDDLPRVTCVMAAANEAALIARKLEILDRQDYPRDKLAIIVVSDASTDGTDEIVRQWAAHDGRVRLLRTRCASGKPTALNLARARINTEVTVFMDVRQDLTPGAVRELVAHLADPTVGVVSGDMRLKDNMYWRYERFVRRCESRSGSMVQVTGSLYAIRTHDVPIIPPETILDDVYVPLTVALTGRRIVMAERAGSLDVATRSVGHEFRRKVRTLAGVIQVCHVVKGCVSPLRNPLWARFVMHKLSRLACPHALALMVIASLLAPSGFYRLASAAGALVVLSAVAGRLGVAPRLTSPMHAMLALNVAAFWAVPSYYLGWVTVTWTRAEFDSLPARSSGGARGARIERTTR